MNIARVGRVLLTIGGVVGVAASVGLLIGFEPAKLPPVLLNIAAYKLTFLAAFGLLAGGAVVLRYARRHSSEDPQLRSPASMKGLSEGQAPPGAFDDLRQSERIRVNKDDTLQ